MTRLSVLLFLAAGACSVGEVPLAGGGDDTPKMDAPGGGGTALTCVEKQAAVTTAHQHAAASAVPNPPTAAGAACIDCHNPGGPAGAAQAPFLAAGTLYKPDKTTPNPGVTIRIWTGTDEMHATIAATAITDDAGNFRFEGAPGTIPFPSQTQSTACGSTPDMHPMVSPLNRAADGNCSSAGCHAAASATGVIFQE